MPTPKRQSDGHQPEGKKPRGQRNIVEEFEKQAAKLLDHVQKFDAWLCLGLLMAICHITTTVEKQPRAHALERCHTIDMYLDMALGTKDGQRCNDL